jgi:hypothetical protein
MTRDDPNTVERLIEPHYDLERGAELNRLAGEHDPAFRLAMLEGRAAAKRAANAKRG